jgi:LacI family transcriptional regulator
MSKITIKEIANALGMSISTVSRALNDSYQISEATKKRVKEYAELHNYRPDPFATGLKDKKSKTICVIVPELANIFFSQVTSGIDQYSRERGYNIFIFQSMDSEERESEGIDFGLDRRADGFLISLSGNSYSHDHFDYLKNYDVPIVYFDSVPSQILADKVVVDNFQGAYDGTKKLILQGRKKIINISTHEYLSITNDRINGYKKCLLDHNIAIEDHCIKYVSNDFEDVKNFVKKLLSDRTVDGIVLNNGRLTLNILYALKQSKMFDFKKLGIVGFTNEKYPELISPSVIAIKQPSLEMGQRSAQLLIERLEAKNKNYPFQTIVLPTQIID